MSSDRRRTVKRPEAEPSRTVLGTSVQVRTVWTINVLIEGTLEQVEPFLSNFETSFEAYSRAIQLSNQFHAIGVEVEFEIRERYARLN